MRVACIPSSLACIGSRGLVALISGFFRRAFTAVAPFVLTDVFEVLACTTSADGLDGSGWTIRPTKLAVGMFAEALDDMPVGMLADAGGGGGFGGRECRQRGSLFSVPSSCRAALI